MGASPGSSPSSRRRLLTGLFGLGAGALAAPWTAPGFELWSRTQDDLAVVRRPRWPFDVDGDGRISLADLRRVEAAVGSRRGLGLTPSDGWDGAADVLGEGRVTPAAARVIGKLIGESVPPRPLVATWHYGWHAKPRRGRQPVTARYRGGPYASGDPGVEAEFNALKREFGIDADLLSWIADGDVLPAYERGYLRAANVGDRRLGLLYESNINLGQTRRMDFSPQGPHADRLVADFERMGGWLARAAGRTRVLAFDDRPVIYLFGSHTFGTTWDNLPHVGSALARARAAFARGFGRPPYVIGDEALFPGDRDAGRDRLQRAAYFDAVGRYHHYDEGLVRGLGSGADIALDARYLEQIAELERRTQRAFATVRNHYSGKPVTVLPSAAAGFAKRGLPRLRASGEQYRQLLLQSLGLAPEAPVVLAGSWNEEYEGHALMPARPSYALRDEREGGFDWLYAIKSVYGPVRSERSVRS